MLDRIRTDLEMLKSVTKEIKGRQHRLDQALQALVDSPHNLIKKVRDRLRELIANGDADPCSFGRASDWIEVEELAEELRTAKSQLPDGLFRHIWLRLMDSRKRLEANNSDLHAKRQLAYIEKVLANAAENLETV